MFYTFVKEKALLSILESGEFIPGYGDRLHAAYTRQNVETAHRPDWADPNIRPAYGALSASPNMHWASGWGTVAIKWRFSCLEKCTFTRGDSLINNWKTVYISSPYEYERYAKEEELEVQWWGSDKSILNIEEIIIFDFSKYIVESVKKHKIPIRYWKRNLEDFSWEEVYE